MRGLGSSRVSSKRQGGRAAIGVAARHCGAHANQLYDHRPSNDMAESGLISTRSFCRKATFISQESRGFFFFSFLFLYISLFYSPYFSFLIGFNLQEIAKMLK